MSCLQWFHETGTQDPRISSIPARIKIQKMIGWAHNSHKSARRTLRWRSDTHQRRALQSFVKTPSREFEWLNFSFKLVTHRRALKNNRWIKSADDGWSFIRFEPTGKSGKETTIGVFHIRLLPSLCNRVTGISCCIAVLASAQRHAQTSDSWFTYPFFIVRSNRLTLTSSCSHETWPDSRWVVLELPDDYRIIEVSDGNWTITQTFVSEITAIIMKSIIQGEMNLWFTSMYKLDAAAGYVCHVGRVSQRENCIPSSLLAYVIDIWSSISR
jgi:hypothetical protein